MEILDEKINTLLQSYTKLQKKLKKSTYFDNLNRLHLQMIIYDINALNYDIEDLELHLSKNSKYNPSEEQQILSRFNDYNKCKELITKFFPALFLYNLHNPEKNYVDCTTCLKKFYGDKRLQRCCQHYKDKHLSKSKKK